MTRIAITGWMGSGKTEIAKYLEFKYGFKRISFADGIKDIAYNIFGMKGKQRGLLQSIGEKMREIDKDVWIKHTINRLDNLHDFVIDDLRRMNEFEELKANGFVIIRVVSDEEKRIERLIKRDGYCDKSLMYNESENGCADLRLYEIDNNGSLVELFEKVDDLLVKITKDEFN